MLALTIRQPWAHAILHDGKHVENRSWRPTLAPPFRMAIHAGRGYDANAYPGCPINETEKPVPLVEPLISYGCPPGGTVLDLFAGSCSTLVAVRHLGQGRKAVGFEEREEQCEKAARRLSQGVLDFGGEAS